MIFDIVQRTKALFSADFDIVHKGRIIGHMLFQGRLGSMEGVWTIQCLGRTVSMERCSAGEAGAVDEWTFRPYAVSVDGSEAGAVYQTRHRAGLFRSFDYHRLQLLGTTYVEYLIALGKEGGKCPIYVGDRQAALIEKDSVVYNDLHHYHVTAAGEEPALAAVILCGYMYANAAYKPGQKVTKSVEKDYSKTTDKALLEKLDPQFKAGIPE